jgi:hypothetical protein
MAQDYRVREMSSDDFHSLAQGGWPASALGSALVTYEPWLCDYLLGQKCPNRPLSPAELGRLNQALRADGWLLTGETLIFTAAFHVVDGQHRLTAGKETGKAFTSFTVWGVPEEAFAGIDIGKKRSAGDQLAAHAVPDYSAIAAALRVYYRLEHGAMRRTDVTLPDHEVKAYLNAHQKIRYSLTYGRRAHRFIMPSLGAALHYRFRGINEPLADQFFEDLIHGDLLSKRDPILALRDLLGLRRPEGLRRARNTGDSEARADIAAQVIETWNAVCTKKSVLVKWLEDVATRPFPDPVVSGPGLKEASILSAKADSL